jgi:hypothetical protein
MAPTSVKMILFAIEFIGWVMRHDPPQTDDAARIKQIEGIAAGLKTSVDPLTESTKNSE